MTWLVPPVYVVMDIETIAGDPNDAEEWARRAWLPNKNWKPATIGERYLETLRKKEKQLALLDTAPVLSVAMRTEADCRVLHWMPCDEASVAGAAVERSADEAAMLSRLCDYLGACDEQTLLVGHNIQHFDLPKLRRAMLRHGIRLPAALVWRDQPVFDTMKEWGRFTLDDRPFIGLSELLDACGLDVQHKQIMDGAMVPDLFAAGRCQEILAYALADLLAETALFLRMTGQTAAAHEPARARPIMDNSPGNPTPIAPAALVAGRIQAGPEITGGHAAVERAAAREVAAGPSGTIPAAGETPDGPAAGADLETILRTLGV